jgi:hypothetical protein
MKTLLITVLGLMLLMCESRKIVPVKKKRAVGYTLIESGKGINENGDTILVEKNTIREYQSQILANETR